MSGCPGTTFCEYVTESNKWVVGSYLVFLVHVLVYVMRQTIRLQMVGFLGGRYVMGQIQEFNG